MSTCSTVAESSSALVFGVGAFMATSLPSPLRGGVGGGGLSDHGRVGDRRPAISRPATPHPCPSPRGGGGLLPPPLPATGAGQLHDVGRLGPRRGDRARREAEHRQH